MKPNDKVVCVDDGPDRGWGKTFPDGWVERGEVYVVTGYKPANMVIKGVLWINDGVTILGKRSLFEGEDVGWGASRFRLVSEVGHPPIAVEQPQEAGV